MGLHHAQPHSWGFGRVAPPLMAGLLFYVTFSPLGAIGIDRSRTPVALKMALPTAGAMATIGVSPAPAEGRSLRSSRITSIRGASAKRGTRYAENRGLRILPPA